jgi:glycosyltransferase involved in cell wall biosynthesis
MSSFDWVRWQDRLRHSLWVREGAGWWNGLRARAQRSRVSALAHDCRALDLAESKLLEVVARARIMPQLADVPLLRKLVAGLPRYRESLPTQPGLTRSLLLKAPTEGGEKGVLLLYFEYNWVRLLLGLSDAELKWLGQRYDLILAASWSPTDYAALALAVATLPDGAWLQPANRAEVAKLTAFHPNLRLLDSLACDWVNPDFYQPKPFAERSIDLLMIANWGKFKRHWDFFAALTQLPKDLRVVLIGQKEGGRTTASIQQEAKRIGVPQHLEMHESLTIEQVTAMQSAAKVSGLTSRREGGCVAAVESLFAGCALAMRADAHVGSRAHINPQTGALLRPGKMAEDLMALLQRAGDLRPREWAIENISCQQTTAKLNAALKAQAEAEARPWTHDLVLANWRPHPTFAHPAEQEQMRPAYEELHQRFSEVFPADLWRESWR